LRRWQQRFDAQLDRVGDLGFDPVFRRMCRLYLAHAETGFRCGYLDLQPLLLTRARD
jgi:cyclopropane-fatty-acyl-phospholipid synthase